MPLNPLNSLTDLGATHSNTPSVTDTATKASTAVATGGLSLLWPDFSITKAVMIILGLLLIAAGIFGFEKTREYVGEFTKGVKEGAKIAAVAA